MTMSYDSFLDYSLDAYDRSGSYLLEEQQVLKIAERFELGDDKTKILKFADAIQAAFMEENS